MYLYEVCKSRFGKTFLKLVWFFVSWSCILVVVVGGGGSSVCGGVFVEGVKVVIYDCLG